MAITRQENWLGSQRVDVPHLRALESAMAYDNDVLSGSLLGGSYALITSGFSINAVGVVGTPANTLQLTTAGGTILNQNSSESGSLYQVLATQPVDILNQANSKIIGSFSAGASNYIGVDFKRTADPTTSDLVEFINSATAQETSESVPLARTLNYTINISPYDFSQTPNITPVAIVVTDSNNNVLSVTDARNLMFRLGTGGGVPNPYFVYPWSGGRRENASGNVFTGGDKVIGSLKDWMNATMSQIWDTKGGEFWYSQTSDRYNRLVRGPNTFSSGEQFSWDGTNLLWQNLRIMFGNGTNSTGTPVYYNDIADQTSANPGQTDLADGWCLYVDINYTANLTGGTALVASKAALSSLGGPTTPGSRYVIAWRWGSNVFTRDGQFAIGTTFRTATATATGTVLTNYNIIPSDGWTNTPNPTVALVNEKPTDPIYGAVMATGLSRGGLEGGTGAGNGTLTVGGGSQDLHVVMGNGVATLDNTFTSTTGSLRIGNNGNNIDTLSGPATLSIADTHASTINIGSTTAAALINLATENGGAINLGTGSVTGTNINLITGTSRVQVTGAGNGSTAVLVADTMGAYHSSTALTFMGTNTGANADWVFVPKNLRSAGQPYFQITDYTNYPIPGGNLFSVTGTGIVASGNAAPSSSSIDFLFATNSNRTASTDKIFQIGNNSGGTPLLNVTGPGNVQLLGDYQYITPKTHVLFISAAGFISTSVSGTTSWSAQGGTTNVATVAPNLPTYNIGPNAGSMIVTTQAHVPIGATITNIQFGWILNSAGSSATFSATAGVFTWNSPTFPTSSSQIMGIRTTGTLSNTGSAVVPAFGNLFTSFTSATVNDQSIVNIEITFTNTGTSPINFAGVQVFYTLPALLPAT